MSTSETVEAVIIGGGPAGLTAAYELTKRGRSAVVLEADPTRVGGISRTEEHRGFCFDIGGHRFFSKSQRVEDFWSEVLPDDMLERPRSSRIYYGGKFYDYPLRGLEALKNLGPVEAARCLASYAKARALPVPNPSNVEDWVSNQFGQRLYEIFFKTYTEKVWGIPCREISADWAAQRIKGLSLSSAVLNALMPKRQAPRDKVIKTLIDSFRYPRKGPGMLWEACARKVVERGGEVRRGARVTACEWSAADGVWTVEAVGADGAVQRVRGRHVISSTSIPELVRGVSPAVSDRAREAASRLRFRDFVTVALILRDEGVFDDNWLYIHDPTVRVGRVQHFKSWSPEMVPDPAMCCYGMEYFCFEGDGTWTASDGSLLALAERELTALKLCRPGAVTDGHVVRQAKAYPVYDADYARNVDVVRRELEARFPTLHLVGRNGMHKYNNQDHAMMTAMLTVENIAAGRSLYDVWRVNQDAEYHEAGDRGAEGGRLVPRRVSDAGA